MRASKNNFYGLWEERSLRSLCEGCPCLCCLMSVVRGSWCPSLLRACTTVIRDISIIHKRQSCWTCKVYTGLCSEWFKNIKLINRSNVYCLVWKTISAVTSRNLYAACFLSYDNCLRLNIELCGDDLTTSTFYFSFLSGIRVVLVGSKAKLKLRNVYTRLDGNEFQMSELMKTLS